MACNKDITFVKKTIACDKDITFIVDFVNRNVLTFYGDTLLGDTDVDNPVYMNIIKLTK